MNNFTLLLLCSLGSLTFLTQQSVANDAILNKKSDQENIVTLRQKFSNLPKKQRDEYGQKFTKAQNLFNQKRIFEALEKIEELDRIFKDHPKALNIKGACYVEIRAFNKANAIFEQVLATSPTNTNVQFNLAEVDFVTKNWESAHTRFTKLIPLLPVKNKAMVRLCEFKLLLCNLKTDRIAEAITLRDKHSEWDDSPFFYYSRAAVLYHKGDKPGAEKMLHNVRFVWRNDTTLAAWQDTLIEFGYIRSFYGGDIADDTD